MSSMQTWLTMVFVSEKRMLQLKTQEQIHLFFRSHLSKDCIKQTSQQKVVGTEVLMLHADRSRVFWDEGWCCRAKLTTIAQVYFCSPFPSPPAVALEPAAVLWPHCEPTHGSNNPTKQGVISGGPNPWTSLEENTGAGQSWRETVQPMMERIKQEHCSKYQVLPKLVL